MTATWPSGEPATLRAEDMEYRAKMSFEDARLMAAAPDLLAALERILDEGFEGNRPAFDQAQAAVAKTRGVNPEVQA